MKHIAYAALRRLFEVGQRFRVNILPHHFYSQTPDIRQLQLSQHWRAPLDMVGVSGAALSDQIEALEALSAGAEARPWANLDIHGDAAKANGQGGGYGVIEADILYAFILKHRPARVVQVGCGVSTAIILRAGKAAGYQPDIICVEPYPSAYLAEQAQAGHIRLIAEAAQQVERDVLTALGPGDMLFVDSTHTVKPGSEVNRIILDVLPRIGPGVFVHFHDIYFPYDYQRALLTSELFFNVESTLLHAFLIGNARFRILLSTSMLHHDPAGRARLAALCPRYRPQNDDNGLRAPGGDHFPSATYLVSVAP